MDNMVVLVCLIYARGDEGDGDVGAAGDSRMYQRFQARSWLESASGEGSGEMRRWRDGEMGWGGGWATLMCEALFGAVALL